MTSTLPEASPSSITIHLAAIGPWSDLPELNTPFTLSCEAVEPTWREDLIQRGWESGVLEKKTLKQIRKLPSVIFAELSFQPYIDPSLPTRFPSRQLRWARAAVKLLKQLADHGAEALYFDGALKVFTPELLAEVNPKDDTTLFHLFVEVWGDEERVATEGMSIFGLPEVVTLGLSPQSPQAQATTFSAAAQLVCDDLRIPSGSHFRSSESFPWCEVVWTEDSLEASLALGESAPEEGEGEERGESSACAEEASGAAIGEPHELYPCGACVLRPVSDELGRALSESWLEELE